MTPPAWIAFGMFALLAIAYAREVQIARRETPPGPPPLSSWELQLLAIIALNRDKLTNRKVT